MGLALTHKKNQGAHVEGRGRSLELLVTGFEGRMFQRAELKITEDGKSRELSLKCEDGYVGITDYLEIRIVPRNPYRSYRHCSVRIDYQASRDYLILRNELLERVKNGDK